MQKNQSPEEHLKGQKRIRLASNNLALLEFDSRAQHTPLVKRILTAIRRFFGNFGHSSHLYKLQRIFLKASPQLTLSKKTRDLQAKILSFANVNKDALHQMVKLTFELSSLTKKSVIKPQATQKRKALNIVKKLSKYDYLKKDLAKFFKEVDLIPRIEAIKACEQLSAHPEIHMFMMSDLITKGDWMNEGAICAAALSRNKVLKQATAHAMSQLIK